MKWQYDEESDCAYLKFTEEKINNTLLLGNSFCMDFDATGAIVGLEVMNAKVQVPEEYLKTATPTSEDEW